jgi:hypothetical protein
MRSTHPSFLGSFDIEDSLGVIVNQIRRVEDVYMDIAGGPKSNVRQKQ